MTPTVSFRTVRVLCVILLLLLSAVPRLQAQSKAAEPSSKTKGPEPGVKTKEKGPETGAKSKDKSGDSSPKAPDAAAGVRAESLTVNAKSAVLMEAVSGYIILAQNKDDRIPPASFVKVLTLYVVQDLMKQGKLKPTDEIAISKKAWSTGGSKMFVDLGAKVPLEELMKGIAVVSGNDACIAVAEHVAGSVEAFVKMMNDTAQKLGMTGSHFDNPHGLPSPQQYTTAYDMAMLAQRYVNDFPEALKIHSLQEYTFSGISQQNRNRLLRKDPTVDGIKTGFIEEAGYHLVATAKRDDRRLIAVVMGAKNPAIREEEAQKLLNHGYRNFAFVSLLTKGKVLAELPVWKGKSGSVTVVPGAEAMVVVPVDAKNKVEHEQTLPETVTAPITKDQVLGQYVIKMGTQVLKTVPLVAAAEVPEAGFFKRLYHSVLFSLGKAKTIFYILGALVVLAGAYFGVTILAQLRRPKSRVRF